MNEFEEWSESATWNYLIKWIIERPGGRDGEAEEVPLPLGVFVSWSVKDG